jgi:hypothetical protein
MDAKQFAESLRQLADWYAAHPEAPVPAITTFNVFRQPEQLAADARMLAPCDKVGVDKWFVLRKSFGAGDPFDSLTLEFNYARSEVCTPRVVGQRVIPAEPEKVVDVVEWDCGPILGAAGSDVAL